jgi:phosphoribosylanthranilate isomerase
MIKVKADNVNSLTDARYFAAKNVNYICYNYSDSKINIHTLNTFIEWIEGPKTVVEVSNISMDDIFQLCSQCNVEYLQLDIENYSTNDYSIFNKGIILSIDFQDLENNLELVETFISKNSNPYIQLNFTHEGSFSMKSIEHIQKLISTYDLNVIINANLGQSDLENILELIPGTILCISGSDEEKVGLKSFDDIESFFDVIEQM